MKACIFDLDGTLTNTLESMTYSVNLTLEEMGLSKITKRSVQDCSVGKWSQGINGKVTEGSRRHRCFKN